MATKHQHQYLYETSEYDGNPFIAESLEQYTFQTGNKVRNRAAKTNRKAHSKRTRRELRTQ